MSERCSSSGFGDWVSLYYTCSASSLAKVATSYDQFRSYNFTCQSSSSKAERSLNLPLSQFHDYYTVSHNPYSLTHSLTKSPPPQPYLSPKHPNPQQPHHNTHNRMPDRLPLRRVVVPETDPRIDRRSRYTAHQQRADRLPLARVQ